ncbi:MAG: hypothetical protein H7A32_01100 [Deltaproteobacteria bacterium]|nr:hypothetical protein [Deltaproteobacteria bacterium]
MIQWKKNFALSFIFLFTLLFIAQGNTQVHAKQKQILQKHISPLEELLILFITTPDASIWEKVDQIKSIKWKNTSRRSKLTV